MQHAVSAKFTASDGTPLGEVIIKRTENQAESFRYASAFVDSGNDLAQYIASAIGASKITYEMKGVKE